MKFLVFLFLLNFDQYILESPISTCYPDKPLKTKDNTCTNFVEICVKKDDTDCNNFQSACKQCPASNYSILMFLDIMNVKNQINITNLRLNSLEAQLESNKRETANINKRQNYILILSAIILIVLAIILVLIIFENRFKIFTKMCNKQFKRNGYNYKYLNSRKYEVMQESFASVNSNLTSSFQKFIDSLDKKIESNMNEMFHKMETLLNPMTKFKIEGYPDLFYQNIGKGDTIVKIKRDLCERISKNFKIMKMKLNGILLDDNNILSSEIDKLHDSVVIECYFDNQIKANEIVVVNVDCQRMNPILIQMRKDQTIADLKNILSRFNKSKNLIILKGTTKLDDENSINDLQLIDNDMLTSIEKKHLKVSSVFDDETTVRIEYYAIDKVETLKHKIAHKNSSDSSLYVLFIGNQCLDEKKYVYDYVIENESSVQYCCLKKLNGVTIGPRLHKGKITELLSATEKNNNKEMLLLKYDVLSELEMKKNEHIIKELEVFQIAKLHERFVKLLDIYHKDQIVYVAMENMSKGTVKMYLEMNFPLKPNLIQRWSKQILDGLEHLHKYELVLRDINPNHILVDKDENVKLYSFNLSKCNYGDNYNAYSSPVVDSPGFHFRYSAPEIFLVESCGTGTDIWSLGAVLIKLSTKQTPLHELSKDEITEKFRASKYIEYELPTSNNNPLLKDFIDSCLKPLEERPTIAQLKNHKFIKDIQNAN